VRLWSVHPKYLDSKGLVAVWREALLAKKVLEEKTKGYKHHPQLTRFRTCRRPIDAINAYLERIYAESLRRGYRFDGTKITHSSNIDIQPIPVTDSQIDYEFRLLRKKLKNRNSAKYEEIRKISTVETNSLFTVIPGRIAEWEKVKTL
jgi:hypothetical protein